MKTYRILFFIFFLTMFCYSQNDDFVANEMRRMVQIPNSPEAQEFAKYGEHSVSLYTGAPDVSVPIYTHQGREMALPITLTYDARGIKVEQLATNVGLGWNLNIGGRISRVVNGLADDYNVATPSGYSSLANPIMRSKILGYLEERNLFNSLEEAVEYREFKEQMSLNKIDAQPDYYSLNVMGLSDYMVFDTNDGGYVPRTMNNPRIRASNTTVDTGNFNAPAIATWTIIGEDGSQYFFEKAEETEVHNDDYNTNTPVALLHRYNSSWLLTKIISSNRKDTYTFEYLPTPLRWQQPASVSGGSFTSVDISEIVNNPSFGEPQAFNFQPTYWITQQILTKVFYNDKLLVSIDLKSRADLSIPSAIDQINIHKPGDEDEFIQKVRLNHTYFGLKSNENLADKDMEEVRLKLDNIEFISGQDNTIYDYSFDYFSPEDVPKTYSLSQDYMGYYNGADNNVLYPRVFRSHYMLQGAVRDPSFLHARVGSLKRMHYPTGGYSDFEYEAHTSPFDRIDLENELLSPVTYSQLAVPANNSYLGDCGPCCQDKFVSSPRVSTHVFTITDGSSYDINYSVIGERSDDYEMYLIKLGEEGECGTGPVTIAALGYDEIVDQATCQLPMIGIVWNRSGRSINLSPQTFPVSLGPGCYQITGVMGPKHNAQLSMSVTREESETINEGVIGEGSVERAGIRVKSIKNFTGNGSLAREREYRYVMDMNSPDSTSGVINFYPRLDYIQGGLRTTGISDLMTCTIVPTFTHNRVGTASGGERPHVTYERVFEVEKSVTSNAINGYTKHDFYLGNSGIFSSGITPNVSSYIPNGRVGKPRTIETRDQEDILLTAEESDYGNLTYFGVSGLYLERIPTQDFDIPVIRLRPDGKYDIFYTQVEFGVFQASAGPGAGDVSTCAYFLPSLCNDPNNTCPSNQSDARFPFYQMRETFALGKTSLMARRHTQQWFNGETIEDTTDYNYYMQDGSYLLKSTTNVNSEGETLTTTNFYAKDGVVDGYQALQFKNCVSEPVRTQIELREEDGTTLNILEQRKDYVALGNSIVLPSKLTVSKEGRTPRKHYFEYHPSGNLRESRMEDGPTTTYLWGYDDFYPIAKLENTTFDQVANINGNFNLSRPEGLSLNLENQLRNGLPGALISTYTYDPFIGVTTMTDSRGYTMYYEYDELNRLEFVKDADGNLISENKYNYKDQ